MSLDKQRAVTAIEQALSDLRYGSIEITVHDGRVVQIDRTEKVRLETAQPHVRPSIQHAEFHR